MKILFVITGLGVGGAERQVVDLADRFALGGAEVAIAYLTGDASVLPTHPAVRLHGFGIRHSLSGLTRAYAALRRLIREFRPDVVHSHMVHANLLARLVRLTAPMPRLICTAHSSDEGGKLRMLAYRLTDALADLSTNVSASAVAAFEAKGAVPKGRMLAVVNGIDTDRFHPDEALRGATRRAEGRNEHDRIILAVGSLTAVKDYPTLLRAFAKIEPGGHPLHLWIVGAGPLRAQLEALAAELGVRASVRFFGVRFDTAALYNAADVCTLASLWEGFGLVVAEAMASGKVVVATDCGGPAEVLGGCGSLVPPGDPQALAAALFRALALDPQQRARLGAQARERVLEQYSLQRCVRLWRRLYTGQTG